MHYGYLENVPWVAKVDRWVVGGHDAAGEGRQELLLLLLLLDLERVEQRWWRRPRQLMLLRMLLVLVLLVLVVFLPIVRGSGGLVVIVVAVQLLLLLLVAQPKVFAPVVTFQVWRWRRGHVHRGRRGLFPVHTLREAGLKRWHRRMLFMNHEIRSRSTYEICSMYKQTLALRKK